MIQAIRPIAPAVAFCVMLMPWSRALPFTQGQDGDLLHPNRPYDRFLTIGDNQVDTSLTVVFSIDEEKLRVEFTQRWSVSRFPLPDGKHYVRDGDPLVWEDGTVTLDGVFKILLRFGGRKDYYQFIVNEENTQFDAHIESIANRRPSFDHRGDFEWFSQVVVPDSLQWRGVIEIPWESIFVLTSDDDRGKKSGRSTEVRLRNERLKRKRSWFRPHLGRILGNVIEGPLYLNFCASYVENGQMRTISLGPFRESIHEPGNYLKVPLPGDIKVRPYSGDLVSVSEQILGQLIQFEGEELVGRRTGIRELARNLASPFHMDKLVQLFRKFDLDDIPLDVLGPILGTVPKEGGRGYQKDTLESWLIQLAGSTQDPERRAYIDRAVEVVRFLPVQEKRGRESNEDRIPAYYLGLVTRDVITPSDTIMFGSIVFPIDPAETIYTKFGSRGQLRYSKDDRKSFTYLGRDNREVDIPRGSLLLFPSKGKSLRDSLTLFSSTEKGFQLSGSIDINPHQPILVIDVISDPGEKRWLRIKSVLLEKHIHGQSAWVSEEDFVLDTNFVYVEALEEYPHVKGSSWDFLHNSEQMQILYELATRGRDVHGMDLVRMSFPYAEKLITLGDFETAESILRQYLYDDIQLLPPREEDFYESDFPASIQARFKLIELYGDYMNAPDKLREIVLSTVRDYPGRPVWGFEWNSFADYSAIRRAIRYLDKAGDYYEFLQRLEEVSTYPFTSTYIELLQTDYFLEKERYGPAMETCTGIIRNHPSGTKRFYLTTVNYHSSAITRFIWMKLITGATIGEIHDQLFSLLPDTLDREKYEMGFQKMVATYMPVKPVEFPTVQQWEEDPRAKFSFVDYKIPGVIYPSWKSVYGRASLISKPTHLKELPSSRSKNLLTLHPGQKVLDLYFGRWSMPTLASFLKGWTKVKLEDRDQYGWVPAGAIRNIELPKISSGFLYPFRGGETLDRVAIILDGKIHHVGEAVILPVAPERYEGVRTDIRADRTPQFFAMADVKIDYDPAILSLHYDSHEQLSLLESYDLRSRTAIPPDGFFRNVASQFPNWGRHLQRMEELFQVADYLRVYSDDLNRDGLADWILEAKHGETLENYLVFYWHEGMKVFESSSLVQGFILNGIVHLERKTIRRGKLCISVSAWYPSGPEIVYTDNCMYESAGR